MAEKLLQKVSFFRHLNRQELARILAITKTLRYSAGDIIFSKEDAGDTLYMVKSGKIRIFTQANRRQKTLDYLKEGDIFGEMALLDGKVRSASAQALDDSELLAITKNAFFKLIADRKFTLRLLDTLSMRLREADKEIEALLFQNMLGRLARAIIKLAGPQREHRTAVKISLHELANYIGTTREPLSRALASFKRCGLIDYEDKTLKIKDYRRLSAIAPN
ncbi:MAG TPA: Crp/Fnr family transcriptional regulator [Elusimicrobiales bacterium]|nr:Crp/Fnr family transcriptional regulator [Elusimicrobiales bacterium]